MKGAGDPVHWLSALAETDDVSVERLELIRRGCGLREAVAAGITGND